MPLFRYFLFTGALLTGLLFWTDWYFPKTADEAIAAEVDRSIIRIHSDHRWPAAVRFDTDMKMPDVALSPTVASAMLAPAQDSSAQDSSTQGTSTQDTSVRQAYAFVPVPPKAPEKLHRRAKPIPRLAAARETRRRLASNQPNWFSTAW